MAWCRQATSHYLTQCWLRSTLSCGVTKQQSFKASVENHPVVKHFDANIQLSSSSVWGCNWMYDIHDVYELKNYADFSHCTLHICGTWSLCRKLKPRWLEFYLVWWISNEALNITQWLLLVNAVWFDVIFGYRILMFNSVKLCNRIKSRILWYATELSDKLHYCIRKRSLSNRTL